jgi:hypothetical protein
MSFEEFENKARLYVLGALDEEETAEFQEARLKFGREAEEIIKECRKLNSVFALSLRPNLPKPETKALLMEKIRNAMKGSGSCDGNHSDT